MGNLRALALLNLLVLAAPPAWPAQPATVVASIGPVHSLVAGVMQGIGAPHRLIRPGASPHDVALRPSDVRALGEARVVFWIGPELESVLVKPLSSATGIVAVELARAPGVRRLPKRAGGAWDGHRHHDEHHGHVGAGQSDPHIWLDPHNAMAIVRHVGAVLSDLDASNAPLYRRNVESMLGRLDELDRELAAALAPVAEIPYLVFHDAYQHFETRYGLNAIGALVVGPGRQPGARRVRDIRERVWSGKARCVFSEPQFQSRLVATLLEGTPARSAVLDPIGAALAPGPGAYFSLMRNLAASLSSCLDEAATP